MSKRHLRKNTTCPNCGNTVHKRYCETCGQENTETRMSFGHLVKHFIEDLTHYDGKFLITMRYLLFRPAYLTKEYLKGRRMGFVPPVRLYFFISFITFLLPHILPDGADEPESVKESPVQLKDTANEVVKFLSFEFNDREAVLIPNIYKSVRQLDSTEALLPESERMNFMDYWFAKKYIYLQKYNKYQLGEKFFDPLGDNFPKALFIYLPLFAFVLWLFHNKKRWLYFDHAIFTLHYFSFLLLVFNLMSLSGQLFFLNERVAYIVITIAFTIVVSAIFIYFFVAHKKMYQETPVISFVKSLFIYAINLMLFIGIMAGLAFVSLFSIS